VKKIRTSGMYRNCVNGISHDRLLGMNGAARGPPRPIFGRQ